MSDPDFEADSSNEAELLTVRKICNQLRANDPLILRHGSTFVPNDCMRDYPKLNASQSCKLSRRIPA
jgi:hypothetical protein